MIRIETVDMFITGFAECPHILLINFKDIALRNQSQQIDYIFICSSIY